MPEGGFLYYPDVPVAVQSAGAQGRHSIFDLDKETPAHSTSHGIITAIVTFVVTTCHGVIITLDAGERLSFPYHHLIVIRHSLNLIRHSLFLNNIPCGHSCDINFDALRSTTELARN